MARETQGLQIALIVFVVLTIILGVTTYLFFRSYDEASRRAATHLADATKANNEKRDRQEKINHLKELLGFAITETPEAIDEAAEADMQKFAANFPEEKRFYRPVLEYLHGVVREKNEQLANAQAEIQQLKSRNEMLEAVKDPQIKEHKDRADTADESLAAERAKFNTDRKRLEADQAKVADDLDRIRKAGETALAEATTKIGGLQQVIKELVTRYKRVKKERDDMVEETFEVAQGEVRWVNQRNRAVYVNLGWADSLARQTTFSVYDADVSDMTKTGKKGSIEVTKILSAHLAEAKIIDDQIRDPIMPGDKVHTPIWTPGSKKHFVLVGLIDINGDGRSDRAMVRNLIEMNGGVVDAPMDDSGRRRGNITVNTRYLVRDKKPDEKSSQAMIDDHTTMLRRSKEMQIEEISLDELLRRMGWKNQTPVLRFDAGGPSNVGSATADASVRRVSHGNVSELFKRRQPPSGEGEEAR